MTHIINQSIRELAAFQPQMSRPVTVKEELIFIEAATQKMYLNKSLMYGIFLKNTDECLGSVSTHVIDWSNLKTEIGYWISSVHTCKGFATEACLLMLDYLFMDFRLHRVSASVAPDNPASLRVMQKLCFSFEGEAKEALYISGNWKNLNIFALLSDTYSGLRKGFFEKYFGGNYPKIKY
ncbi:MAG: GNAT family N-acetyltransferase [Chlorobiales bacterium]|nr:GNAT family N-acetyltransferase [Chlorobiales bacterium]